MAKPLIFCILSFLTVVNANKPPVLIWSSSRTLNDLPLSYAGQTVDTDNFHSNYLKPLTSDSNQNLVVFVQDKLSVEDFTNHADVYNPNSDGGSFKNVKGAMDDQFSVHLPSVSSPVSALDSLSQSFPGKVVKATGIQDLDTVPLDGETGYLIIVTLTPVSGKDEAKTFKANDEIMGEFMKHLSKRGVQYSAIYTAKSSSKVNSEEAFQGRHLLADAPAPEAGKFFNDSNYMLYIKGANMTLTLPLEEQKTKTLSLDYPVSTLKEPNVTKENDTLKMELMFENPNGTITIMMVLRSTSKFEWESAMENFTYKGKSDSDFDVENMPITLGIGATLNWCFHCSRLVAGPVIRGFNNTKKLSLYLALNGLQIQAFDNSTHAEFTDNVWDCVEFFTMPIWMGIITTIFLVLILFFGITMMANITTMDRFDDPKGKTITVTVNE